MKRVFAASLVLAAAVLSVVQTPRAPAQEIPTGGQSCSTADQAARNAVNAAWGNYIDHGLGSGGAAREYGGLIYRTPEGGYGFTAPERGSSAAYDPGHLLDPARPSGNDDPSYTPHLRTGEEVVGGYHIHPDGGGYRNDHFSPNDEAWTNFFNVPNYLRSPNHYYEHDPDTGEGVTSNIDASDGSECGSSADMLTGQFGEPHFTSHDGVPFDFQAAGEFVSVQSADNDLTVQTRMEPLAGRPTVSVITAIAVKLSSGRRVAIYLASPHTRVDGAPVTSARTELGNGGSLTIAADRADIVSPEGDRIRVYFSDPLWLNTYFQLAPQRRGQVAGLLGNFDADQQNEFMTRGNVGVDVLAGGMGQYHQRLYRDWGDSWRIDASETLFDYLPGKSSASYDLRDYPAHLPDRGAVMGAASAAAAAQQCRAAGVKPGPLFDNCVYDIVISGNARAVDTYSTAQALTAQGYIGPPPLGAFNLARFAPNATLAVSGDAAFADGRARLTPAAGGKRGALFTTVPAPVVSGFVSDFTVAFSSEGGAGDSDGHDGGDGIAFLISGSPLTHVGEGGLALGYGDLDNVLVVEFDTWRNVYDPSSNHVSVHWSKPDVAVNDDSQASLASSSAIPGLSDGRAHHVHVDYMPGRLRIFIDDMTRTVIDTPLQLQQRVHLRNGMAWLGFTAGTALAYQNQDIVDWRFTPRAPPR